MPLSLIAQKTDIIITEYGGRIIGEIKKLDRGRLEIKTEEMGTLNIEWDDTISIQSKKLFDIETSWGEHYFGSLEPAEETGKVTIVAESGDILLALDDVVRIYPLESKFWSRIKGYIDAGFSYQTADNFAEIILGGEAMYRSEKWINSLSLDTYLRTQKETAETRRNNLHYHLERIFKNRWSGDLFGTLEQNDELELDLRAMLGIGGSRYFIQNNHMMLRVFTGADIVRVKRFGDEAFTTNFEALLGGSLDIFYYSTPRLDFAADLVFFPNLTEFGRLRIYLDARIRYEVLHNFFIGLTVFDKFDGDFREGGTRKSDFGINTTLSWSFR